MQAVKDRVSSDGVVRLGFFPDEQALGECRGDQAGGSLRQLALPVQWSLLRNYYQ